MYPAFIDANRRRADQHSALYQNIMIDLVNMGVVTKATVNGYLDYDLPERYIVPANDGGSDGDNTPGTDTTGTDPQGTDGGNG